MGLSLIHSVVLTAIGIYSLARIPVSVEANRDLVHPVKRGIPFKGHDVPLEPAPGGPPRDQRPGDYSKDPAYLDYLAHIEDREPRAYIVRSSYQLSKEPEAGEVGIYATTDEDGVELIRVHPSKTLSEAWNRFLGKYPFMKKAQFKLTGQDHSGLRSKAMTKLSTFSEDMMFNLFRSRPKSFPRPLIQFDSQETTPAESARSYAMMREAGSMARNKPQARLEIMPYNGLRSGGDPKMEMEIINSLNPDKIPADVSDDLRALAEMPRVVRKEWPWRPTPFRNLQGDQMGHFEMNRKDAWAVEMENDRTKLARMLSAPILQPGVSREEQLTAWNEARLQKYKDNLEEDLRQNNYMQRVWAGESRGRKRKRDVLDEMTQQEEGTPPGENNTAAAEFGTYLDLFQATQSNITEMIVPYIYEIMNLTTNSSIITALAASVFTDMTASVDHNIGPFMHGFDCLDWLETQYTNATSADDLSDDMLVVMAVHELLAQVYGTVWANATAQMNATGLLDQSITLARFVSPEDLSMAPSLFTTVGGTQTAANATEMEEISSNGTIVHWKRSSETQGP